MNNNKLENARKEAKSIIDNLNNENFDILKKFDNKYLIMDFTVDLEKEVNGYMLKIAGDEFTISISQGVHFGDTCTATTETKGAVFTEELCDDTAYDLWNIAETALDRGSLSSAISWWYSFKES